MPRASCHARRETHLPSGRAAGAEVGPAPTSAIARAARLRPKVSQRDILAKPPFYAYLIQDGEALQRAGLNFPARFSFEYFVDRLRSLAPSLEDAVLHWR